VSIISQALSYSVADAALYLDQMHFSAWASNCYATILTLSVSHFFWLWQKWVYQSVQCHTGLTHPFIFLTFGNSIAQSWGPECQNVKKVG